ncbi:MAG: hypothetical protein HUJ16_07270 [Kangiella sp.]|nr:hypothetical protein [Kangiella sp.]
MNNVDCSIKHWQVVTFIHDDAKHKVVRGIIIDDCRRPFEPGYWVCSTPIIYENFDKNIVQTKNTLYGLVGEGEFHETDNFEIYDFMYQGLTFQQAKWAVENGAETL